MSATESPTEILITRVFDAPAELVFDAWTTPDIVKRWWAGDRGVVHDDVSRTWLLQHHEMAQVPVQDARHLQLRLKQPATRIRLH